MLSPCDLLTDKGMMCVQQGKGITDSEKTSPIRLEQAAFYKRSLGGLSPKSNTFIKIFKIHDFFLPFPGSTHCLFMVTMMLHVPYSLPINHHSALQTVGCLKLMDISKEYGSHVHF